MQVAIKENNSWRLKTPNKKLIFVIVPGAGTFKNKNEYERLKKIYNLVYFGRSGGEYDKYPDNWNTNILVQEKGKHLGGIAELIYQYINDNNQIPLAIICGSRGGQVTIGKVWSNIWRGPSIIINAGCLTTKTYIPKHVFPIFITMKHDYFQMVNSQEKVINLFYKYILEQNQRAIFIHLTEEYHMPIFDKNLKNLLCECIHFISNNSLDLNISLKNVIITKNY